MSLLSQAKETSVLRHIIMINPLTDEVIAAAKAADIKISAYDDIVKLGAETTPKPELTPPLPDDIAVICYTSGTTGDPKGMALWHRRFYVTHGDSWALIHERRSEDSKCNCMKLSHLIF